MNILYCEIEENNHLGHIMLECLKTRKQDDIFQIDTATGEEETYGSVLTRTVAMARSLRGAGLQPGDVMVLSGRNHLNLRIPYYAALMNGLPVAGIDPGFKYEETKRSLAIVLPKIAFCELENYEIYSKAVRELGLDTKVFTFFEGRYSMAKYDTKEKDEFRPSCFDTDKVYAWLISTSGTTGGALKFAAIKHGAAVIAIRNALVIEMFNINKRSIMNLSPVHWVASYFYSIAYPLMNISLLQMTTVTTSASINLINKYKPSIMMCNPSFISLILKHEKQCDLFCLDIIVIGGAKVYKEGLLKLKSHIRKDAMILEAYGMTEIIGGPLCAMGKEPLGSCGTNFDGLHELKLMDVVTGTEVTKPYKHGELWVKGPACFTEYYNNPEETANAITKDGWFKTGDILYRDDNGYYYFVERLKMLIKYRINHVYPTQLEEVLETHSGVLEVCVTRIPHEEDGEWPVACVVRRPGHDVTAQEIKDLVSDKLSDANQLRGGVLFMDSLPRNSTGKVCRLKIQEMVRTMKRE